MLYEKQVTLTTIPRPMFTPIFSRKKPRQGVLASPLRNHEICIQQNQPQTCQSVTESNMLPRGYFGGGDVNSANPSQYSSPGHMNRIGGGSQQISSWQQSSHSTGSGDGPQPGYVRQNNIGNGRPAPYQVSTYSNQGKETQNSTMTNRTHQNFQFKRTVNNTKRPLPGTINMINQSTGNSNKLRASSTADKTGPTRPPKLMGYPKQPERNCVIPGQSNHQWSQPTSGTFNKIPQRSVNMSNMQTNSGQACKPNCQITGTSRPWEQSTPISYAGSGTTAGPTNWGRPKQQETMQTQPPPPQTAGPDPMQEANVPDNTKRAKTRTEDGVRIFPVSISNMKLRVKGLLHEHQSVMFEIIAQVDSAVSKDEKTGRNVFQLKDETGAVKSTFFEIDRSLPRLTRGKWHRCVGHYCVSTQSFKCVSIRPAKELECVSRKNFCQQFENIVRKLSAALSET